jgi:hypothetical protein
VEPTECIFNAQALSRIRQGGVVRFLLWDVLKKAQSSNLQQQEIAALLAAGLPNYMRVCFLASAFDRRHGRDLRAVRSSH